MNTGLMVDGNAIAGELEQIFGRDMTTVVTRCSACAADSAIGALMNFMRDQGLCCVARRARQLLSES